MRFSFKPCLLGAIHTLWSLILFFSLLKGIRASYPVPWHQPYIYLAALGLTSLPMSPGQDGICSGQVQFPKRRGVWGRGDALHVAGESPFACTVAHGPPQLVFPCLLAQGKSQDIRKGQNFHEVGKMGKEWKNSTNSNALDVAFQTSLFSVYVAAFLLSPNLKISAL